VAAAEAAEAGSQPGTPESKLCLVLQTIDALNDDPDLGLTVTTSMPSSSTPCAAIEEEEPSPLG
jgi:hypothetical protein